ATPGRGFVVGQVAALLPPNDCAGYPTRTAQGKGGAPETGSCRDTRRGERRAGRGGAAGARRHRRTWGRRQRGGPGSAAYGIARPVAGHPCTGASRAPEGGKGAAR